MTTIRTPSDVSGQSRHPSISLLVARLVYEETFGHAQPPTMSYRDAAVRARAKIGQRAFDHAVDRALAISA